MLVECLRRDFIEHQSVIIEPHHKNTHKHPVKFEERTTRPKTKLMMTTTTLMKKMCDEKEEVKLVCYEAIANGEHPNGKRNEMKTK